MKSLTFLASALAAAPLLAAVPVIDTSAVSVQQGPGKTVVIDYTMNPATSGDTEPAIVTVDILTNAVGGVATSVGGEHLTTLSGWRSSSGAAATSSALAANTSRRSPAT